MQGRFRGLRTTDDLVEYLRERRAQGELMVSDSSLNEIRTSGMTRRHVETKTLDKLEEALTQQSVPRGVAEHVAHQLRLAVLDPKDVYCSPPEPLYAK
jgi:hypothetical protein